MTLTDELRPRDLAVLRTLAEAETKHSYGIAAGHVAALACPDEPYRGRRDAGMTRTLDRLERLGFVRGHYEWEIPGRFWTISDAGRAVIA